jgi:hypothetical protein
MKKSARIILAVLLLASVSLACNLSSLQPTLPAGVQATVDAIVSTDMDVVGTEDARLTQAARRATPTLEAPTLTPTIPVLTGGMWYFNGADKTVLHIDLMTNEIISAIAINSTPSAIAWDSAGVWVVSQEENAVIRIDPLTDTIVATTPFSDGLLTSLAIAGGSVWAGYGSTDGTKGGLVRINPATNEIQETIPMAGPVKQLAPTQRVLWVLIVDKEFSVVQNISASGEVSVFYDSRVTNGQRYSVLAADEDSVWLFSQTSNLAHRFELNSGQVVVEVKFTEQAQGNAVDIALSPGALWAAMVNGTVARFNSATGQLEKRIEASNSMYDVVYAAGSIWAFNMQTARLYRIDSDINRMAGSMGTGSTPMPTIMPTATATLIITVNPSAVPTQVSGTWQPCTDSAYASRLHVGNKAVVSSDPPQANRVREQPDLDGAFKGYVYVGVTVSILDGPRCANGWVWWYIKSEYDGLEGWTSEGDSAGYWLVPKK